MWLNPCCSVHSFFPRVPSCGLCLCLSPAPSFCALTFWFHSLDFVFSFIFAKLYDSQYVCFAFDALVTTDKRYPFPVFADSTDTRQVSSRLRWHYHSLWSQHTKCVCVCFSPVSIQHVKPTSQCQTRMNTHVSPFFLIKGFKPNREQQLFLLRAINTSRRAFVADCARKCGIH